jgi:molybdopterin synthase sulfur carrier subunit
MADALVPTLAPILAPTGLPTGTLHILYFAWLRERVGAAEENLVLPPDITTVGGLVAWLRARSPRHAAAFAAPDLIRCAVNQDFAAADEPIRPGDEVAFFPPITGG